MAKVPVSVQIPPNRPRVIEVLAFPSVQLLDVAGPPQVCTSADDPVAEAGGAASCASRFVAQGGGVTASAGLTNAVDPLLVDRVRAPALPVERLRMEAVRRLLSDTRLPTGQRDRFSS